MTLGILELFHGKVKCGKLPEHEILERFEGFDLKIGTHSCLNEYMKICEYKTQRSFFFDL